MDKKYASINEILSIFKKNLLLNNWCMNICIFQIQLKKNGLEIEWKKKKII